MASSAGATRSSLAGASASSSSTSASSSASSALEGPLLQRHFFHARIRHPGGTAALPVVLILQHDDLRILTEQLPAVIEDVLWIVQNHAGSILPNASQPAPKIYDATAVYHGHIISASFEVREAEANYGVMEIPDIGTRAAGRGSGGCLIDVPVTGFRLFAYVRHKESEIARRTARFKAGATPMDAYVSGGGAGSTKGGGAAGKPRASSAGAKRSGAAGSTTASAAGAASAAATARGGASAGAGASIGAGASRGGNPAAATTAGTSAGSAAAASAGR